jgi:serine/threonine-protein kinase
VDINQPGWGAGIYQDGPVIGRITKGEAGLSEGTLLHGRLWTGPGIYDDSNLKEPAIMGRYTLAVLPDGRKYPVCIALGDVDGRVPRQAGSKDGAAVANRQLPASIVFHWR